MLESPVFVTATSAEPCDASQARKSDCSTRKKTERIWLPGTRGSQEKTGFSNCAHPYLGTRLCHNQSAILAQFGRNWLMRSSGRDIVILDVLPQSIGLSSTLQGDDIACVAICPAAKAPKQGTKRVLDRSLPRCKNPVPPPIVPEGKYFLRSKPAP